MPCLRGLPLPTGYCNAVLPGRQPCWQVILLTIVKCGILLELEQQKAVACLCLCYAVTGTSWASGLLNFLLYLGVS